MATGNTMMALGHLTKKVSLKKLFHNWIIVSLGNLLGALFIVYFLGHYFGCSRPQILRNITVKSEKSEILTVSHFKRLKIAKFEK